MKTVNARFPASPPCVLITGFDAFGGFDINPSWLAAKSLHGLALAGHAVIAAQLPTQFVSSQAELMRLILLHQPDLIVCTGQAGGRAGLSLERAALNICDADIADNAGAQPTDLPVISDGPAAYFSTLPIRTMLEGVRRAGLRIELSNSAGTFVCNQIFYYLMHLLAAQQPEKRARGGFIHVPFLPEQGLPSMPLLEMVAALRLSVEIALTKKSRV